MKSPKNFLPYTKISPFTLGTDGDDESEESDVEHNGKKNCKKSSKHSAQRKHISHQQHQTMKTAAIQKSTSNGEELKQSLTQLLNTGSTVTEDIDGISRLTSSTSATKMMSMAQDEAWVEVS